MLRPLLVVNTPLFSWLMAGYAVVTLPWEKFPRQVTPISMNGTCLPTQIGTEYEEIIGITRINNASPNTLIESQYATVY